MSWGPYNPHQFDAGWLMWAGCSIAVILKIFLGKDRT